MSVIWSYRTNRWRWRHAIHSHTTMSHHYNNMTWTPTAQWHTHLMCTLLLRFMTIVQYSQYRSHPDTVLYENKIEVLTGINTIFLWLSSIVSILCSYIDDCYNAHIISIIKRCEWQNSKAIKQMVITMIIWMWKSENRVFFNNFHSSQKMHKVELTRSIIFWPYKTTKLVKPYPPATNMKDCTNTLTSCIFVTMKTTVMVVLTAMTLLCRDCSKAIHTINVAADEYGKTIDTCTAYLETSNTVIIFLM